VDPAPCPGCGLVAEPAQGPTHSYIGASPGCWALHGQLMVAGLGPGQLVTDTYAVQHPGVPQRRAIQSVCVHLVSLCAALERGWPPHRGPDLLRRALAAPPGWRWLDPQPPLGTITVADVLGGRPVHDWAQDVWTAYEPHQATVRGWLDTVLSD
jgi:Family of unknown function (DUF5946)